jgi:hypothetical protein
LNPRSVLVAVTFGGLFPPLHAGLGDGVPPAIIGTPFALPVSQSVPLEGADLIVRFAEVTADSRCPVEVTCVWAGVATVILALQRDDRPLGELTLDTLGKTAEAEGLRFTLVELDPPPSVNVQNPDYLGTFLVEPARP